MWLGLFPDITEYLREDRLILAPGDALLLYTDGVTEALGPGGDLFSQERLASVFGAAGGGFPESVRDHILASLEGYQCPDDVTILVIRRRGEA